jgi:5-methylcytosine-specific restriction endonuclease McrA
MTDCLVLTHTYEPYERCSWDDAMKKFLKGSADVLEWTEHLVWEGIIEVSGKIYERLFRPMVIRLLNPFSRKRSVRFSRENVYARDKGCCQYCGKKVTRKESTLDHVTPRAQGGPTRWENVVISCFPCNQRKKARTPREAGMRLASEPMKPRSLPLFADLKRELASVIVPDKWVSYLYWNVGLEED